MRHNNDILWKGLLEWVFDDLLRFVFPNADEVFDMEKGFAFLDKELAEMYPEPEKETDVRIVDKLVTAGGQAIYFQKIICKWRIR